ncbi:MAG: hypothetical protein HUU46_15090 [Candidatus Hydrogenedentes bacterium]|nr:hypothetical protein [Candidatus Hydrogenedentota bacterium]
MRREIVDYDYDYEHEHEHEHEKRSAYIDLQISMQGKVQWESVTIRL